MTDLYQSQRAMRALRRAAMHRGVVAILDVGTSKIACLVLSFDGTDPDGDFDGVGPMAGQAGFRVIGAATTRSRGVRFGEISMMNETERAIRTAVQAAQKMANVRVGERRWDMVLDRDQRLLLPSDRPVQALERLLALDQAEDLLARDLVAIDLRDEKRPVLRLGEDALMAARRARGLIPDEKKKTESDL